jgi:hypothetical protein
MKWSGRGHIWGTIRPCAWRDWVKSQRTSFGIVGVPAEIRTSQALNTSRKPTYSVHKGPDNESVCIIDDVC